VRPCKHRDARGEHGGRQRGLPGNPARNTNASRLARLRPTTAETVRTTATQSATTLTQKQIHAISIPKPAANVAGSSGPMSTEVSYQVERIRSPKQTAAAAAVIT